MILTRIRDYVEQFREFHRCYRRGERLLFYARLDRHLADVLTANDYIEFSEIHNNLLCDIDRRAAQRIQEQA